MQIRCRCRSCTTRFKVPAELAGRNVRCPKCHTVFIVPSVPGDSSIVLSGQTPPEAAPTDAPPGAPAVAQAGPPPKQPPVISQATPVAPVDDQDVARGTPEVAPPIHVHVRQMSAAARVAAHHRWRRQLWVPVMAGLILAACLGVLVLWLAWLTTWGPQTAQLVIELPVEMRRECALFVNRQRWDIRPHGPLELRLSPGVQELTLRRRGYQSITRQFTLSPREVVTYTPHWIPLEDSG